ARSFFPTKLITKDPFAAIVVNPCESRRTPTATSGGLNDICVSHVAVKPCAASPAPVVTIYKPCGMNPRSVFFASSFITTAHGAFGARAGGRRRSLILRFRRPGREVGLSLQRFQNFFDVRFAVLRVRKNRFQQALFVDDERRARTITFFFQDAVRV